VAAGLAQECEIQLAYAIGVREPISINVNSFGTGKVSDEELREKVNKVFDLSPTGIIEALDLRKPKYQKTAVFGHFGRDESDFLWEKTNRIDELLKA